MGAGEGGVQAVKRRFPLLALAVVLLLLAACGGSPTPDLVVGVQAAASATPAGEPTDMPRPTPTVTPPAQPTALPTPHRILFIGNSYTFSNDLPERFAELMGAGGKAVEVGQCTSGGWSLSNHLTSEETLGRIAGGDWHTVVLQEQSVVHNVEEGMYPAVRALDAKIRAAGAETVLFMTWGRQRGLGTQGAPDFESMQAQIAANYAGIADELGLVVAPVGIAWQEALARDPEVELWGRDGSHPSLAGTYLAASVFYAVLCGENPEGLAYTAGLPEETARFLQRAAAETVLAGVE